LLQKNSSRRANDWKTRSNGASETKRSPKKLKIGTSKSASTEIQLAIHHCYLSLVLSTGEPEAELKCGAATERFGQKINGAL